MATIKLWRDEVEGGFLPMVCARDGVPADRAVRLRYSWCPQWVLVFILFGLLIWVVLALVLTKYMTVELPVSDDYMRRRRTRRLIAWLPLVGLALLFFAGLAVMGSAEGKDPTLSDVGGVLAAVGGFGAVGWLVVAAVLTAGGVRPSEITDDSITLTGVSPEFVRAVEDARDEEDRRDRRRSRRGRDDSDD